MCNKDLLNEWKSYKQKLSLPLGYCCFWYAHVCVRTCFLNHLLSGYLFNTFIDHKQQVGHCSRYWKCSGEQNSASPFHFWHLSSVYFKKGLRDAYSVKLQRKNALGSKANRGAQCTRHLRWSVCLIDRWEVPFVRHMTGQVFGYDFPKDIWSVYECLWYCLCVPLNLDSEKAGLS